MDKYRIIIEFDWNMPSRLLIAGPDHNGDYAVRDHAFMGFLQGDQFPTYSEMDYVVYGTGGRDLVDSWGDEWPPNPDSFGERPSEDRDAIEDRITREERRELEENYLWLDNSIQFSRLLSEIMAVGLEETAWDALCESMDLTSVQLSELFDRAETEWERQKEITRRAQMGRK